MAIIHIGVFRSGVPLDVLLLGCIVDVGLVKKRM